MYSALTGWIVSLITTFRTSAKAGMAKTVESATLMSQRSVTYRAIECLAERRMGAFLRGFAIIKSLPREIQNWQPPATLLSPYLAGPVWISSGPSSFGATEAAWSGAHPGR